MSNSAPDLDVSFSIRAKRGKIKKPYGGFRVVTKLINKRPPTSSVPPAPICACGCQKPLRVEFERVVLNRRVQTYGECYQYVAYTGRWRIKSYGAFRTKDCAVRYANRQVHQVGTSTVAMLVHQAQGTFDPDAWHGRARWQGTYLTNIPGIRQQTFKDQYCGQWAAPVYAGSVINTIVY